MRFVAVILNAARSGWVRGSRALLLALLGGLWLLTPARAQEGRELEYEVKAAFLVKFAMFVQWPTNALAADVQGPLVVGILGEDPFGAKFDQAVKNERVQGRAVEIRRAQTATELLHCQIVFICASEAARFKEVLAVFKERPVLTVADEPGFATLGGMIGFFKETGKVRFEINAAAIERAGLKVSSKLLQVGRRLAEPVAPKG